MSPFSALSRSSTHPGRSARRASPLLLALAGLLAIAFQPALAADTDTRSVALAARGHYLVTTSGCADCHTPLKMGPKGPEPDLSRHLSGHPQALQMPAAPTLQAGPWMMIASATNTAFAGPWGMSFSANLTPDPDTGLGLWTLDDFKATLRTGRHLGRGREVLPPMPIPAYSQFNDADLEAIFAHLRTLPPVKNRVPEPRPPVAAVAGAAGLPSR